MEERKLTFKQEENLVKGAKLLKINRALSMDISYVIMKKKKLNYLHSMQQRLLEKTDLETSLTKSQRLQYIYKGVSNDEYAHLNKF